jgi:hypothetical protein
VLAALALAGCGTTAAGPGPGTAASLQLSLKTVPTVRSVTVSPAKASFGRCQGGSAADNTASTNGRLGYPNGKCWVGLPSPYGVFPIKITNSGIASYIDVNGSSATPSDNDSEWGLCNVGSHPAVACSGKDKRAPGNNQYLVENFGPNSRRSTTGLTSAPACDAVFTARGKCWAVQGASQTEGIELIGPAATSDNSTSWTVTITWTPVPG